jgi:hypothetical protein
MEFESPFTRVVVRGGAVLVATQASPGELREAKSINGVDFATLIALAKEQDREWKKHFNTMLPELLSGADRPLSAKGVELVLQDGAKEVLECAPSRSLEKIQALTSNFKGILELAAELGLSKSQVGAAFHVARATIAAESGGSNVMEAAADVQQQCKQQ